MDSGTQERTRAQISIPDDVGRRGDERIVLDVVAWSRYACDVANEGCEQEKATSSITIAPSDEPVTVEEEDGLTEETSLPAPGALVPILAMALAACGARRHERLMGDADAR